VRFTRARAVRSGHGEATAGQRVLLPAITLNLTFDRTGDIYMSKTNTIRLVFATVASTLALSATAMAADLGGNCCADLEERVAELEATAARKGNRKVSLTVYGQVNESVIFWNDGQERNAYVVGNNHSRTRFGFRGDAKITNDITAGYLLEVGVRYAGSNSRSQNSDAAGGNSNTLDIRQSNWFLASKSLGTVSVGLQNGPTEGITEINLSGVILSTNDLSNTNQGFFLRNNGVQKSALTWANLQSRWNNNAGEGDRNNSVKYTSPTFAGFVASSSWGEDDKLETALRYAGEFNGVRLAAGIGYQKLTDFNNGNGDAGCANLASAGVAIAGAPAAPAPRDSAVNCEALGMSISAMHVPTGLYFAGAYGETKDKNLQAKLAQTFAGLAANDKNKHFALQAGIEQKWFGLGKSTIYGEYVKSNTGNALGANGSILFTGADPICTGCLITSSSVKTWAVGFNQAIDAAAADAYIRFSNTQGTINTLGFPNVGNTGTKDFQAVMTGMVIRF
jgi:predicted porin